MISPKPFLLSLAVLLGTAAVASAHPVAPPAFTLKVFAGAPNKATSGPDDITLLNQNVFVGWQNGIGPTGKAAPKTHKTTSLVVEYSHSGKAIGKWSLTGKVDGIAGDPALKVVVVTVNEDGNTSLYTIKPGASKAHQYTYTPSPDAAGKSVLSTGGGTDSVAILGRKILVSASAPTHSGRTATFLVTLKGSTAHLHATFLDNAKATDALTDNKVKLHLTDPDSNAVVPSAATLFGGDYVLDSQADGELIFASGIGGHVSLTRLPLAYTNPNTGNDSPATVDDVRWATTATATLYIIDNGANKIYSVKGPFGAGDPVASMDTVSGKAFGTQVDTLNPGSGELDPLINGLKTAKGLAFAP